MLRPCGAPLYARIERRVRVRQESGCLHIFHEFFHLAELHIGRKCANPIQPRPAAFVQQQALCACKGGIAEDFKFFARQIRVQADCDRGFQIIMRAEAACKIKRPDLRRADVHAFQKRCDHRMCGGLAGQELPDVVLCEIERYFAVIGVNDGWNIALPHIVPHIADVRRGAFLKIPRRIDPSGEEPLCDQIENTTAPKTTSAEKTTEKASVKKTALSFAKNAGGKDLTSYKPEEKATSSKAETTAPIVRPVSGSYTSYFGYRTNPITGNNTFHTGVDIAAAEGTKIKAAYSGRVRKVGEDSRSGKYLYLTHTNGVETLYCHCSKILAEEGAVIRQGETVALVGSTGWSTGPHLHFEVHKDGTRLDPLPILKKG